MLSAKEQMIVFPSSQVIVRSLLEEILQKGLSTVFEE